MTDETSKTDRLVTRILKQSRTHGVRIVTAESCTGGLVAAALTGVAGSSDVFERGFVTYSNEAKKDLLGVPDRLLRLNGAVSAEVVAAMALGAIKNSKADLAVAVTGIAGPGGGNADKPVGLVHFAVAHRDGRVNRIEKRFGPLGRAQVRAKSVEFALALLIEMLETPLSA